MRVEREKIQGEGGERERRCKVRVERERGKIQGEGGEREREDTR